MAAFGRLVSGDTVMAITELGQTTFFVLAVFAGGTGTVAVIRKSTSRVLIVVYGFAVLFAGLGLYGPEFLEPYGRVLRELLENGGKEAYTRFLQEAGAGKI